MAFFIEERGIRIRPAQEQDSVLLATWWNDV